MQAACGDAEFSSDSRDVKRRTRVLSPATSGQDREHSAPSQGGPSSANAKALPAVRADTGAQDAATMLSVTFPKVGVATAEIFVLAENKTLEQKVELISTYQDTERQYQQISRLPYDLSFTQGSLGEMVEDSEKQVNLGLLDLVVVVDNSRSMEQEQNNLSTKLAPLLQAVVNSDWRLNVVTTDPAGGCSRALIKKGDANAEATFASAVTAGITGTSNEQGIRQAVAALNCSQISDFPRSKSSVAVLIVSDEDNCSNGQGCAANEPWRTQTYLLDYLSNTLGRVLGSEARVYGVFWRPDDVQAACSTGAFQANQYDAAVKATKGISGSICDADYKNTLQRISSDMATILKNQMTLSQTPDAGTLKVYVNDVLKTEGYTLQGRVITFTDIPPAGATIKATYVVGATPIKKNFVLSAEPAAGTLEVKINDQKVDANAYVIDPATLELQFLQAPPAKAVINAKFLKAAPLLTSFDLMQPPKTGTVAVLVNGQAYADFSIDGTQVILSAPPVDGASIKISFSALVAPVLTYDVKAITSALVSYSVHDGSSDEVLSQVSIEDGMLQIPAAMHAEGRLLVLRGQTATALPEKLELPDGLIAGTVEVQGLEDCPPDSWRLEGNTLILACAGLPPSSVVTISYEHQTVVPQSYTHEAVADPEHGSWQVLVNGVTTANYQRQGQVITLTETLSPEDSVTINYWPKGI